MPAPTVAAREPIGDRDYHLLFVCTANICRSAFANARMEQYALPGIAVDSAGTHALVGRHIDPPMARHLDEPGVGERHGAKQLTRELVDAADLVVAMSERHRDFILEEWPHVAKKTFVIGHIARELPNLPAGAAIDEVAAHLWTHRTSQRGDSVRDPYGRGDSAAAEAARKIDDDLDVIAGVLGKIRTGERP